MRTSNRLEWQKYEVLPPMQPADLTAGANAHPAHVQTGQGPWRDIMSECKDPGGFWGSDEVGTPRPRHPVACPSAACQGGA